MGYNMKKKTLQEVLEYCKKTKSLDELLKVLNSNEYITDEVGKTVKIRMYKDRNGEVQTEVLSICDYKDINEMSITQLEEYYKELEEQYDDLESDEPDEEDEEEHDKWEEDLEEIEDEMDDVKEKMEELKEEK